eukprot:m51a1_g14337 hypothetical protein (1356) ;mRNA; r:151650-157768
MRTIAALIATAVAAAALDTPQAQRVVNGNPVVSAAKYPWMTSLLFTSPNAGEAISMCGGALIAPTWVLTAAHCVDPGKTKLAQLYPRGNVVVVGSLTPTTEKDVSKMSTVLRALTHPDFDLDIMHNDVALLKLTRPITGATLAKIAPAGYADLSAGTKVWGMGWGLLYEDGVQPTSMMEVKLPIVSREDCRRLNNDPKILNSTLCTMYHEGGRDTCQGDSGGPLVHVEEDGTMVQVGVTSYGTGCARIGSPGVYTRVSEFRQWIDSTMASVDSGAKVCGCPRQHIGNGHCNMLCFSEECRWDGGDCNGSNCSAGCTPEMLANDVCDAQCATLACELDNNACKSVCSERCPTSMVNNGVCDVDCLTPECLYDKNDCLAQFCDPKCPSPLVGNGQCDPQCYNSKCNYDGGDCDQFNTSCALNCDSKAVHNGVCDPACDVKECHYDGGDCDKYAHCRAPLATLSDGKCSLQFNTSECLYDGGDCLFCAPRCSLSMINNSRCDYACYNATTTPQKECGFDSGSCSGRVGEQFCSVDCLKSQIGDGVCQEACFNDACRWDATDCVDQACGDVGCMKSWSGDGYCQPECLVAACGFEGGDCFDVGAAEQCAPGCFPVVHRNNSVCDPACVNRACDYDAPDCQPLFGCAPFCLRSWVKDGECDHECDTENCSWDGGDCAGGLPVASASAPRVVNAEAQGPLPYPWLASLYVDDPKSVRARLICGGTLIAPAWVLTAAHCVDPGQTQLAQLFPRGEVVVAGSQPYSSTALRALTHPDFDHDRMRNDVALLQLAHPVAGVAPAQLAPAGYADLPAGAKVWGWGPGVAYEGDTSAGSLDGVKLPVISREDCRRLNSDPQMPESTLCTMFREGGRDMCQGDDGGPLLLVGANDTAVQVGITSYGKGCARVGSPRVYSRVSEFRQWIDSTMAAVDRGDKVCGCPSKYLGNGHCNMLCFSEECRWDGGDCSSNCSAGCTPEMLANDVCDAQCATLACGLDNNACKSVCSERCPTSMINNGVCDPACLTPECLYDEEDCVSRFCHRMCPSPLVGNGQCDPLCYDSMCNYDGGDCNQYNTSCALNCDMAVVNNSVCDPACDVRRCNYDGGDCDKYSHCSAYHSTLSDGKCNLNSNNSECLYDGGDCLFCAPRCSLSMLNNSRCDYACYNATTTPQKECGFDSGSCSGRVGEQFCSVDCLKSQIGDGVCQEACFNEACRWDAADCAGKTCNDGLCLKSWSGDGYCQPECLVAACGFEGGDCFDVGAAEQCAPGCFPVVHRNNSVCDPACVNRACDYDAPDCQPLFGCAPFCLSSWVSDGECDRECDTENCSFDGHDCAGRLSVASAASVTTQTAPAGAVAALSLLALLLLQ